mmetsp:Transcript_11702/g.24622  ORF Transcript_11702/g.24622 Transcript_11702/m.24622 type:complete len:247 (-) Transcript_11702:35-775(-)
MLGWSIDTKMFRSVQSRRCIRTPASFSTALETTFSAKCSPHASPCCFVPSNTTPNDPWPITALMLKSSNRVFSRSLNTGRDRCGAKRLPRMLELRFLELPAARPSLLRPDPSESSDAPLFEPKLALLALSRLLMNGFWPFGVLLASDEDPRAPFLRSLDLANGGPEVGSTGEVRPTFSLRAARTLIAPAALCRPWWECLFPASKCNDLRRPTVPEGRTPTVLPHHTDPRRQLLQQYQYTSTLACCV